MVLSVILIILELTAGGNSDLGRGFAALRAVALNCLHNVHALGDRAEHDVRAVKPGGLSSAEKELGAVCAWSSVGHGEDTGTGVLELEVLIIEFITVDGLAAGTVLIGEVTTLAHETGDDAVEGGLGVTKALVAGAENTEVFGGLGDDIGAESHLNATEGFATGSDIEIADGVGHFGSS